MFDFLNASEPLGQFGGQLEKKKLVRKLSHSDIPLFTERRLLQHKVNTSHPAETFSSFFKLLIKVIPTNSIVQINVANQCKFAYVSNRFLPVTLDCHAWITCVKPLIRRVLKSQRKETAPSSILALSLLTFQLSVFWFFPGCVTEMIVQFIKVQMSLVLKWHKIAFVLRSS